jgi:tRNA modification GTPase
MRAGDTIFALASGRGRVGIGVIRVSGREAGEALRRLCRRDLPAPRRLVRVQVWEDGGELLDEALAAWFPAPGSFTGEDVLELHVHGGRAVVDGVLGALAQVEGARMAEPGEFSRRAFYNGKLDLTAVEGLADLVAAETAAQRRQALRQMNGALQLLYDDWRHRLLHARARLEAAIDFSDEDLPDDLAGMAQEEAARLHGEMVAHLAAAAVGQRIRDGIEVAVVGPVNAGKSTLVNALAGRDVAIVAATAGTTRDVLEVPLDVGGYPVLLCDTAGLRGDGGDAVEREGIRRAKRRAAAADVRLAVFDGAAWPACDAETAALVDDAAIVVLSKGDLRRVPEQAWIAGRPALVVAAGEGRGLTALWGALEAAVRRRFELSGAAPATRLRHRQALEACTAALAAASAATAIEIAAEELRVAADALGQLTGRAASDEVLDLIFAEFCIGK